MNKVFKHVKITGFTHFRNIIQAAMRIVGEEGGMKKPNAKKEKVFQTKKDFNACIFLRTFATEPLRKISPLLVFGKAVLDGK